MIYLRNFSSVSDANTQGTAGLESPHVDIIDGLDVVNFAKVNGDKFTCSFDSNGYIQNITVPHNLGDICYWNGSKLAYTPYTSWQSSLGTPLAVCVIPTSHNVYGNGKAGFMSVKGVTSAGTESSSDVSMVWGPFDTDTPLTNYTVVPTWDNTVGGSVGSNEYGYLSGDALREHAEEEGETATQNTIDTSGYYFTWGDDIFIPSPYAADGSFYTDYKRTISGNNALSDFNGKSNTEVLAASGSTYIAANACHLYSTDGITAGEWYLPAEGELAYIMPRFNVINSALTACSGVLLDGDDYYWSSTEYDEENAYRVLTDRGDVCFDVKLNGLYVRPFASLS